MTICKYQWAQYLQSTQIIYWHFEHYCTTSTAADLYGTKRLFHLTQTTKTNVLYLSQSVTFCKGLVGHILEFSRYGRRTPSSGVVFYRWWNKMCHSFGVFNQITRKYGKNVLRWPAPEMAFIHPAEMRMSQQKKKRKRK